MITQSGRKPIQNPKPKRGLPGNPVPGGLKWIL